MRSHLLSNTYLESPTNVISNRYLAQDAKKSRVLESQDPCSHDLVYARFAMTRAKVSQQSKQTSGKASSLSSLQISSAPFCLYLGNRYLEPRNQVSIMTDTPYDVRDLS
jgi:hypothetical protein